MPRRRRVGDRLGVSALRTAVAQYRRDVLVGRGTERARLAAAVDAAMAGRAASVLLVGEAGIGKTALLRQALDEADRRGARTCYAVAVESERAIAGAGLSLLVAGLADVVPQLPVELSTALTATSAGIIDERAPAATLALLAAAGAAAPTVVVADDVQWWDEPSRRALLFAVRRLAADPVAVFVAGRPEAREDPVARMLPVVEVGPLAADEARDLLRGVRPGIAAPVSEALVGRLTGNPLALVETAAALDDDVAAGRHPLPDWLPVGTAVMERWARAVGDLDERSRRALLVAGCEQTGKVDVLRAALTVEALTEADLVPAEASGLVDLTPDGPAFRHPLVRAAVLATAAPAERRRAHAALATALSDRPERAVLAAHLAAAAAGSDAVISDRLHVLAGELQIDGALEAAAQAWGEAARLAPDPATAVRHVLAGTDAALLADLREHAEALARRGLDLATAPRDRGLLLTRLGVVVGVSRDIREGLGLLEEAVRLLDGHERADALLELVSLHQFDLRSSKAREEVDRFGPLPSSPRAEGVLGGLLCWAGRWDDGVPLVHRALARSPEPWHSWSPLAADDWFNDCLIAGMHEMREELSALTAAELASDRPGNVAYGLQTLAMTSYVEGCWEESLGAVEEAARLLRDLGRVDYYGAGMAGEIASLRGDMTTLAEWSRAAEEVFTQTGNDLWGGTEPGKGGMCHLAHGDLEVAEERLRECLQTGPEIVAPYQTYAEYEVALVELLARTDRLVEARRRAASLTESWRGCPNQLARGWLERAAAAVADGDTAEAHYRAAIEALEPKVHEFALAQTRLYYGQWLRRRQRRADAVAPLRLALAAFERMRCSPWAVQCRDELAAAGADTARIDRYDATAALTSQERRVAETVAAGLSNAAAARRLFLSPKTIEVHLTHVYRKLGITRRGELATALARPV